MTQLLMSSASDRRDSRSQETVLFLNASADPNETVAVKKKSSKPTFIFLIVVALVIIALTFLIAEHGHKHFEKPIFGK